MDDFDTILKNELTCKVRFTPIYFKLVYIFD